MANKSIKKKRASQSKSDKVLTRLPASIESSLKESANTEAIKQEKSSVELDEGTMIREQERMALAGKKKKRKKWKLLGLGLAAVLIIAGTWYLNWGREKQMQAMADVTVKIEKGPGQTIVYAHIDTINGNEITYTILEEVQTEESSGNDDNKTESSENKMSSDKTSDSTEQRPQQGGTMPEGFGGGSMPGGFGGSGSMPEGFGGGGMSEDFGGSSGKNGADSSNMPDMSQMPGSFGGSGSIPEGFGGGSGSMPEGFSGGSGSMPEGFGGSGLGMMPGGNTSGSAESGMLIYDGKTYRMGSEHVTKYISVGTDVTTKLGTITTFSRLAAEDYVALVMEQDGDEAVIMAVYIIG